MLGGGKTRWGVGQVGVMGGFDWEKLFFKGHFCLIKFYILMFIFSGFIDSL